MFTKKCIGQRVSDRTIVSLATGRRHLLRDVVFERCVFDSVLLGKTDMDLLGRRHEFHNAQFRACCFRNVLVKNAVLEGVTLADCSAPAGGLTLWRCELHEVVFDGQYETLKVTPPKGNPYGADPQARPSFAVDVRSARCAEVELLGIPPNLVHYDPEFGGVLLRDVFEGEGWPVDTVSEYFGGILVKFKAYGGASSVYIVPTEAPDRPDLLAELAIMRSRGWVQ